MASWYTTVSVRVVWEDAPVDDALLAQYLAAARAACEAYAPVASLPVAPATAITDSMALAHLMQTQNLWNAGQSNPAGFMGDDGFTAARHPMDWHVKQLLRPKRAVPVIG